MVELAWIVFGALFLAGLIYTWKFIEYNKKYELQKFDSIDAKMDWLESHGYVGEDGQPIKCQYCANDDFRKIHTANIIYDEAWGSMIPVEYDIVCPHCNKIICHFAYGAYLYY